MASIVPAAEITSITHGPSRKTAATRVQQELRLSLKQNKTLPELLTSAPFAINFLGQLRLLAFSDSAVRITLQRPENGFKHLQYPSLPSAMQQISDQASDAFHCASKNMDAIDKKASALFGQNSFASDILICLQDVQLAKSRLRPAIKELRDGMEECSAKAKGIEDEFDELLATANELNRAMGHQMAVTVDDEVKTDEKLQRNRIEDKIQENVRTSLERQVKTADVDLEKARKQFYKSARGSEWKALGFKTVSDIEGGVAGIINGAVNIVQSTPKLAIAAVQAAGSLGGLAAKLSLTGGIPVPPLASDEQPPAPNEQQTDSASIEGASDIGTDPAVANASRIHDQLAQLHTLVDRDRDLLHTLQEKEANIELLECVAQLKACQEMLGDFESRHTTDAKAALSQGVQTAESILASRELATSVSDGDAKWQEKVDNWRKEAEEAHSKSLKLKAFASMQSGQGFGGTLDIPVKSKSLNIDLPSILKTRHEKLLIMRTAMQEAQDNLQSTNNKYIVTQNRAIELAEQMQNLKHSKLTLQDIRKFLGKAIDTVTYLQREIRTLTLFFNFMSNTISILGTSHTERYLTAVESGITDDKVAFGLSYGDAQTHMIREAILMLRGHFTFVVESARLYRRISTKYILPCIRMTAELRLDASAEEQEAAKQLLQSFTKECASAIQLMAKKELEAVEDQLRVRCEEMEEELKGLPAPKAYETKAIDEGVKEARTEMTGDQGRLEAELDDLLG